MFRVSVCVRACIRALVRATTIVAFPLLGALTAVAAAGGSIGCSSVGATAVRTGPLELPSYSGAVAIYASSNPPANARDLGIVEVHAEQQEGTVDTLLPLFAQKVASLGGNVAVIDGVRARFEIVTQANVDTFYGRCGRGVPCSGKTAYSTNDEVMIVSMFGRAMTDKVPAGLEIKAAPSPVAPPSPPPPSDQAEPAKPDEVTP